MCRVHRDVRGLTRTVAMVFVNSSAQHSHYLTRNERLNAGRKPKVER